MINLCDIKYSDNPYIIDKKHIEDPCNKVAMFRQETKTRKGIALIVITSSGFISVLLSDIYAVSFPRRKPARHAHGYSGCKPDGLT